MRLPVRIIRQTPWQNPKAIKRSPQCDCSAYAIEQRAGPNGKFPEGIFFLAQIGLAQGGGCGFSCWNRSSFNM